MVHVSSIRQVLDEVEVINQANLTVAGRITNMYGPTKYDDWRISIELEDCIESRKSITLWVYLKANDLVRFVTLALGDIIIFPRCQRSGERRIVLSSLRMGSSNMAFYVIPRHAIGTEISFTQAIAARSRLAPKMVSKKDLEKLRQVYGEIENSFNHYNELVEEWWNDIAVRLKPETTAITDMYQGIITDLLELDTPNAREYLVLIKMKSDSSSTYATSKKAFLEQCCAHLKEKKVKLIYHKLPDSISSIPISDGLFYSLKVGPQFSLCLRALSVKPLHLMTIVSSTPFQLNELNCIDLEYDSFSNYVWSSQPVGEYGDIF